VKPFLLTVAAGAAVGCGLILPLKARGGDQYFLLNYEASHGLSTNVMTYVQQKFGPASAASSVKVGVAVIYEPEAQQALTTLTNDLAMAKRLNVPILVQVDTENWLPTALLNWYDPAKPGYDTNKTADVEWVGWSPTNAVKLCWRNWGSQLRVGPQPNLLSTNFQAWERSMYTSFIPYVLQWYNSLATTQKWIFVGWKCGWETSLNSQYYYYSNGNSYYSQPAANDPKSGPRENLGYNAAQTGGIRTNGTITYGDMVRIIGKHLTFLASVAYSNGLPKEKIFLHSVADGTDQHNTDKLINPYSNPGATCYAGNPSGALKNNASFMRAVHTVEALYGGAGYGYGEMNLFNTNYAPWINWFTNTLRSDRDCVFQALYNYDSMQGKPNVEKALLDAMGLYPQVYSVSYKNNGGTIGLPPTDPNNPYLPGATVTVLGSNKLARPGYVFTGWNTAADGSGTGYSAGGSFGISGHTTLYAQWAPPMLTSSLSGKKLVLNWPAGQGCQLQIQTNSSRGIWTNWSTLAGAIPPFTNTVNPTNGAVFHRLIQPPGALGTNLVIYADALASGWFLNGWSATVDPANPAPVHGGTASLAYTLPAGAGIGPYTTSYVNTSNYNFLSFWIHGGATGGQWMSLQIVRGGNVVDSWYISPLPTNTWVNCKIPLSLISCSNVTDFNCVRFYNNLAGQSLPVFYVDDFQLQP